MRSKIKGPNQTRDHRLFEKENLVQNTFKYIFLFIRRLAKWLLIDINFILPYLISLLVLSEPVTEFMENGMSTDGLLAES